MSDSMIATTARPVRRNKLKFAINALLVMLAIALAGAFAFITWLRQGATASLPQVDGTVKLAGISAPVDVVRDAQGVPHISAATPEDLFFAQGYVTAQDRLWQMDSSRRYAAGELSEILGAALVETDTHQRILGLREVAARAVDNLTTRDRAYFEAYARGVNAYIEQHRNSLPLEFRLLRYQPRAWSAQDSALIGAMMAELLNHGFYQQELERERTLAKLGPELTNDLYVNTSGRDILPGADSGEIQGEEESASPENEAVAPKPKRRRHARISELEPVLLPFADPLRPGSNDWVVSGTKTASGKPLLSNDMHLPHRLPNTWYEAHLRCGDVVDVAGVTLPGAPFVIVGHNQRIAWGFTNVGPDVEDVYIENFNDRGEYQTPNGWVPAAHRKETIKVKNGRDVTLDVELTRHGPIITPIVKGEKRKLALKWVIYDPAALTFPFFDVNTAKNWQEFTTAFARFGGPGQNVVYADADGHIGYHTTGYIPIRAAGDGSLPVSGADDVHEWTGYIPFDKLPTVFDPSSGVIATANNRLTGPEYPYSISTQWVAPYRVERIYQVLHRGQKLTPADMLKLQTDVFSSYDRFMAQRFAYAVDHSPKASARAKQAAEILRKWDGRMDKDSAAATIEAVTRRKLMKELLESKLGDDAKNYEWFMSPVWLENVVNFQQTRWLPQKYGSFDELLTAAVESAVGDSSAPRHLEKWKYGEQFKVEVSHPIFSRIPFLGAWSGPGAQPLQGSGNTVLQASRTFGPSERLTVDFVNFDGSTLNIVNGQSGHPMSPYYNDQWKAWYEGTTFTLPYSEAAVSQAKAHELKLLPAK